MSISQISHLNPSFVCTDQHEDMSNSQLPNMFLDFKHESPSWVDVAQIEPLTASTVDNSLASHHSFEFSTDQVPLSQISRSLVEGQDNIDRGYTDQIKFNEDTPISVEGICNGGSYNIETTMDEFVNRPITSSSSLTIVRKNTSSIQWTEDEHKLFILGLKKYGKGDWKSISRNYVTTRSSTQVASHAQKFFIRHESTTRRKRSSIHDIVNVDDDSIVALVGKGLLSHDKALSHIGQHFVQLQQQIDEANIASNTRLESHVGQQHCVHFHQQIDEANIASNTQLESHVRQQHCVQFHQQIDEVKLASNSRLESHVGQQHCVQFHQQIDESNIASNTRLEFHVGQQHYAPLHQQLDEVMLQSYHDYYGTNTSSSSSFQTQSSWDPLHQLQWS